jgi:hypothetical protein
MKGVNETSGLFAPTFSTWCYFSASSTQFSHVVKEQRDGLSLRRCRTAVTEFSNNQPQPRLPSLDPIFSCP